MRMIHLTLVMCTAWVMAIQPATAQRTVAAEHVTSRTADAEALLARPVRITLDRVPLREAIRTVAAVAGVTVSYQRDVIMKASYPVTLHAAGMPLGDVFTELLRGTSLRFVPLPGGQFSIVPASTTTIAEAVDGVITGYVRDGRTHAPIAGAKVTLDNAERGVLTGEDGAYRFTGVSAGTHTVIVKHLGYGRQTRTVTANDGQTVSMDVALEASANVLDQVVVTGMVIPTELKAVPNAITVITAKQIEERGITKIDQLFRGDVPGVFARNQGSYELLGAITMFSRGATSFGGTATTNFQITNPIKTYLDGVELANPSYLTQIDPQSIERIEILTGPQASTIYGSNAINGVMQIFTKRGTSNTPQLTLNLLSGWVENNFSGARTPQHDYSAQLNGLEGRFSYNAGGSWNYIGPWTPAMQTTRVSGFGGARLEVPTVVGAVTADFTLRRTITQNQQRGQQAQTITDDQTFGRYSPVSGNGLGPHATYELTGQTLGITLGYAPIQWWTNELKIGQDASQIEQRTEARGYRSVADTAVYLSQDQTVRHSLGYTMTTRLPVASLAEATVTLGADAWQNLTSHIDIQPQTLTGPLTGATSMNRQPGHNTGSFLQTQFGVKEKLFITYGLRLEWNPNFGKDAQPNYSPRVGVAYTQDVGRMTAKLRASYGRSTRPPAPALKNAQTITQLGSTVLVPYYGNFDRYLANPDLGPEHQQGAEGGLELYFGAHGSLVMTRYNQTVDGLIITPIVDSAISLAPNPPYGRALPNGYGWFPQQQYVNGASIRNQGWELEGSAITGPLTTHGTYSWTKSRTIGVKTRYRAYFANQLQYQRGAIFDYLPEHTWAIGVTYVRSWTTVALNVTGIGRLRSGGSNFYYQSLNPSIRLPQDQLNTTTTGYVSIDNGYALADLTASHQFSVYMEGVVQIQNLADHYVKNDYDARYASIGRQTKLGVRCHF